MRGITHLLQLRSSSHDKPLGLWINNVTAAHTEIRVYVLNPFGYRNSTTEQWSCVLTPLSFLALSPNSSVPFPSPPSLSLSSLRSLHLFNFFSPFIFYLSLSSIFSFFLSIPLRSIRFSSPYISFSSSLLVREWRYNSTIPNRGTR